MEILRVENLRKHYPVRRLLSPMAWVKAVDCVSFALQKGKTLAIVGESGCGKSTLAKVLMRLEPPTDGKVWMAGVDAVSLSRAQYVRHVQMIFQDPYSSLNPRKKIVDIVAEPLRINSATRGEELRQEVLQVLAKVGLSADFAERYPHMLSGGQRQRVGIARALMLRPEILICDEPISALDVSIQAQVLNLLMDLQDEFGLSYIFISHDLSVVRHISDDILVMYLGHVMEHGTREQIFASPQHPYTKVLLASTPTIERALGDGERATAIRGELPSPLNPPPGCPFQKRCPSAQDVCRQKMPELRAVQGRTVACHIA